MLKQAGRQVAYYHPGVGTMGAKNALSTLGKAWTKVRGLAFGYGLSENIADAYQFLMHNYELGDQIFIFGFSRGAYTARALCGMLQMFGLLNRGNEGLIPYALRLFKGKDQRLLFRLKQVFDTVPNRFRIAAGFKKTFSEECRPYFLGVWDTVSSVGWILDPIGLKPGRLPYTRVLTDVSIIRHAVSIDERRAFFRQNLVVEDENRDIKQVWFSGVHSDVGGSYPEAESGLSKISLSWMLREAGAAGLLIDDDRAAAILGGDPAHAQPLWNSVIHNSLTPWWWLGEFWPKWTKRRVSPPGQSPEEFSGRPRLNLFRRRTIEVNATIHQSVIDRCAHDPKYKPSNLPKEAVVEPDRETRSYPVFLQAGDRVVIGIHASLHWNDTCIRMSAGEEYLLEATGRWYDATISAGPDGYESPNLMFRLLQWLRRASKANWFALIGVFGNDARTTFVIGKAVSLVVTADGILKCYANDLPFLYRNNSGCLALTVTRVR